MDGLTSWIISKKYTEDTAEGMGAVQGKNCTVSTISDIRDEKGNIIGHVLEFRWTEDSGEVRTSQMRLMDGKDSFEQGYYDEQADIFYYDREKQNPMIGDTDKMYLTYDTEILYWFDGTGYSKMSGTKPEPIPTSSIDALFN